MGRHTSLSADAEGGTHTSGRGAPEVGLSPFQRPARLANRWAA
jgi:hypothetical protein